MEANQKQLHIKELERFFRFHLDKQKIIIDEIYAEPKRKEDKRVNNGENKQKYGNLMDNLILDMLKDNEGYICESKGAIFNNYIQIYTEDYNYMYQEPTDFCEKYGLGKGLVNTYLDKLYMILEKCFETALNRLQKENKITWTKTYNVLENPNLEYIADEKIFQKLKEIFTQTYVALKMKPIARKNIINNDKFKKKACDLFNEKHTENDIYNFWKVYVIKLNETEVSDFGKTDIQELQKRLCKSICESVQNHPMKIENKIIKPYGFIKYIDQIRKINKLIFDLDDTDLHIQSLQEQEILKNFNINNESEDESEIEVKEELPF